MLAGSSSIAYSSTLVSSKTSAFIQFLSGDFRRHAKAFDGAEQFLHSGARSAQVFLIALAGEAHDQIHHFLPERNTLFRGALFSAIVNLVGQLNRESFHFKHQCATATAIRMEQL